MCRLPSTSKRHTSQTFTTNLQESCLKFHLFRWKIVKILVYHHRLESENFSNLSINAPESNQNTTSRVIWNLSIHYWQLTSSVSNSSMPLLLSSFSLVLFLIFFLNDKNTEKSVLSKSFILDFFVALTLSQNFGAYMSSIISNNWFKLFLKLNQEMILKNFF